MLFINASNREVNCYKIAKDLASEKDVMISFANKDLKYCLGCNSCRKNLPNKCVLQDYITTSVFDEIDNNQDIIIVCPLYMSNITGRLKTFIDRLYPYYNHGGLGGKNIYLILTGGGTAEDNSEEINLINSYFKGISEWLDFNFTYLDYICTLNNKMPIDYNLKIKSIKEMLAN